MSSIAIIIVNFRTGSLVVESLAALALERANVARSIVVYIVDNNSGDDSVEVISEAINREGWGAWVHLRPSPRNDGFAAGNNIALREILSNDRTDYIYFLNPDAVIRPGAIGVLAEFLDERPDVAIVGSRLEEPDGTLSCSAFRFPSHISEFLRGAQIGILDKILHRWVVAPLPKDHSHKTDWVAGASFMVRQTVFGRIGLSDEGFFLYFDEVDFMKSAAEAGLEVWYNPHARVIHAAGSATKIKNVRAENGKLPAYWYDSWRYYFLKHHGRLGAFVAGSGWLMGHLLQSLKKLFRADDHKAGGLSAVEFITRALIPALGSGRNKIRRDESERHRMLE
jgi:N-acetylglucosaminyl-diphospho-decaprenol L-rhamnosyltransferase